MKRLSRFVLLLVLLLGNVALGSPLFFQQDTVLSSEEEVYLSFRYQGVVDEIIVAYYDGVSFYLPLTQLFDLFAINYKLSPTTFSVSGVYLEKGSPYGVDFTALKAVVGSKSHSLNSSEFFIKQADFYVATKFYQELFGLNFSVDLSRLTLRLETEHELPILTRHKRRSRDQLRSKFSGVDDADYPLLIDRSPRVFDGAYLDYSLFSSLSEDNLIVNTNIGLGGEVLFGDMQGKISSKTNHDTTLFSGSDLRWRYVANNNPWYTTLVLGQLGAHGLLSQSYEGFHLSNKPIVPRKSYDDYIIDGVTDPEAEVELYQNNRLAEVIKADDVGYYRFMVPLDYGTSDFKIRIYAKHGEVIELDQRIQIPFNFLPNGELRYNVNSGYIPIESDSLISKNEYLQSDVSFGIRNWLTAGVGVEYIGDANEDKPVFYSKISSRVAGDILLGLDLVAENYYQLTGQGFGKKGTTWNAEFIHYDQINEYNTLGLKQSASASIFYPFDTFGIRHTARSRAAFANYMDRKRATFSLDINQYFGSLRFHYGLREEHNIAAGGNSNISQVQFGSVFSRPQIPRIHPLLRGSYFRGDINYSSSTGALEEFRFQYIKQFSKRTRARLLTSYDFVQENIFYEVGISMDLESIRSTSNIRSLGNTPSYSQTLRGSTGWDRDNNEFLWDNRHQVGRSGISINMFVDENFSGTYEDGEEIIPGNAVTIERSSSRQVVKSGISRLTQLQPYRAYNFRVNEARINNPMLVASLKKFSVVTDPNQYKQVDVPFYTTGIIDGRVDKISEGQFVPISGLRIHLANEDRSYESTLRTFADGSYYSMEVPPGTYECWVDESQLEFLSMNSVPERLIFTVSPSSDGDFVEGLNFILE